MYRINSTLLTKLFLDPHPQPTHPEITNLFNKVSYRMFPGRKDFIAFLRSQNSDIQYKIAERIIHHLCFVSNFPPSYYAIKDVICIENYLKDIIRKEDNYIPRDHFVHLVYLYLLGIYVFFYNREFYIKILHDNRYERKNKLSSFIKLDHIKDFISEWKYFCLYHDIGYAAEIFSNKDKISNSKVALKELNERPNEFNMSLSAENTLKQTSFFSSLEIMSRILVSKFIVEYSSEEIKNDNKLFRIFKESNSVLYKSTKIIETFDLNKEINDCLCNAIRLEKVFSNHCLKPILPIFDPHNIFVFGMNKETLEVMFFSYVKNEERNLIILKKYDDNDDIKKLIRNPNLLIIDDFESDDFELEYILNKGMNFSSFLQHDAFDTSNIEKAFCIIKKTDLNNEFIGITNEEQFLDFNFDVYMFLYKKLIKYFIAGDITKSSNSTICDFNKFILEWEYKPKLEKEKYIINTEILKKYILLMLQNDYMKDIKEDCISFIREIDFKVMKKTRYRRSNPQKIVEDVVDQYIKKVINIINSEDEINNLKLRINEHYTGKLSEEISLITLFTNIFINIKSIFYRNKNKNMYSYNYEHIREIGKSDFRKNVIETKINCFLKSTVSDIEKNYRIPYNNKIDHGFASSKYAASVFQLFQMSISDVLTKDNNEKKLIDILFSINSSCDQKNNKIQYVDNYMHIFQNVLYAIFIHNIYPLQFKDGHKLHSMKTTISDSFSYLALLCDSLQQWNRPQSITPSVFDMMDIEHASEEYNIIVKENAIYLYEEQSEAGRKRLDSYICSLNHLSDVEAFLKIGVYE